MTIAILAHDSRKELALQFCTAYSAILSKNTVIATAEVLLRGLDQGDLDYREGMHPALVEPVPAAMPRRVTA